MRAYEYKGGYGCFISYLVPVSRKMGLDFASMVPGGTPRHTGVDWGIWDMGVKFLLYMQNTNLKFYCATLSTMYCCQL